jgi:hypothetical protein
MHKNATKCNETIYKWCKNKHGASKIIDTFETYHTTVQKIKEPDDLELPTEHMTTKTMKRRWGAMLYP